MFICIAGKNRCSIDALRILIKKKFSKKKIFALPNSSDDGQDNWQPSFKKYCEGSIQRNQIKESLFGWIKIAKNTNTPDKKEEELNTLIKTLKIFFLKNFPKSK